MMDNYLMEYNKNKQKYLELKKKSMREEDHSIIATKIEEENADKIAREKDWWYNMMNEKFTVINL
jgi:hypothetical protein